MKNSEEMVNSLLERRDRYVAERKKKKAVITRTVTSMCCVCLVAFLGFGIWQGGMFRTSMPDETLADGIYPGVKDTFNKSKGDSPDDPAANNKIIVHQVDDISGDMQFIYLGVDDFVVMDKDELNAYYGINVFPVVPDDIQEWEDQRFGIYKRNDGTGEVYWDGTGSNYANADYSRTVSVGIVKDSLPQCDYVFLDTTEEKSIINNVEVAIGRSDNGYYYAQFMYCNVGFHIVAHGLTQDEFVAVIASLVK